MSEQRQWKEKILNDGDVVHFVNYTRNYGRAEFGFCPTYKYGKLKDLRIYPLQQADIDTFYRVNFKCSPLDWSINTSLASVDVKIWIFFWCKEHKSMSFRIYVPAGSSSFSIHMLSNFNVRFKIGGNE